jgi:hypothetical protein
MRDRWDLVAITNDIYTKEDQRILTVSGALAAERIMGVETGGCPHTAIREDASINLEAIDRMLEQFPDADIVFVESGGDNLAATFSPELSDLTHLRHRRRRRREDPAQGRPRHHQERPVRHQQDRPGAARGRRPGRDGSRHQRMRPCRGHRVYRDKRDAAGPA